MDRQAVRSDNANMRFALLPLALAALAVPATAQEDGRFLFDFSPGHELDRAALAQRVFADARDIADAAVILCATTGGERGRDQRRATISLLEDAGTEPGKILDAGTCTPEITGRSNSALGDNRVWLALSNVVFLENYRRERLGL